MNDIFKLLITILAFRAEYYDHCKDDPSRAMAWAYENVIDMAYYASQDSWDCLRQFGWSDEAEALLEKIGYNNFDVLEIRDLVKKEMWKNEM